MAIARQFEEGDEERIPPMQELCSAIALGTSRHR